MKNLIFYLFIILITCSCSCSDKKSNSCIIKGKLPFKNAKIVVLPFQEVKSIEEADKLSYNAILENGKFQITLDSVEVLRNIRISTSNNKYYSIQIFSESGSIISLSFKDNKIIASGSKLNDEFNLICDELHYKEFKELEYKRDLTSEEQSLKENYSLNLWKLVKKYPKSIALSGLFYEKYWGADPKTMDKIINSFSSSIKDSYYLQKMILRRDNQLKTENGNIAPAFSLLNSEGKEVKLSDFKDKFLLIDFWASWCGPCRAEIPNVKNVYKEFHEQGLEVLSLSTDSNEKKWLKAVEDENMPWLQVRDTKKVSNLYNITFIPNIFLIGPDGKIIAQKLHGNLIWKELEKLGFNKK